jgi:hypothetical protein
MLAAIGKWCDPKLLDRIRLLERLVRAEVSAKLGRPRLTDAVADPQRIRFPENAAAAVVNGVLKPELAMAQAWDAVVTDFKRRVERGEVKLLGVSTWPVREVERRLIPHLWAADLWLGLTDNRISVVQSGISTHTYIAVVAMQTTGVSEPAPVPQQNAESLEQEKKPGGRKSYDSVIEVALRDRWTKHPDLRPKPGDDPPVWSELARALLKDLQAQRRKLGSKGKLPHENTIRKALPRTYARVLDETGLD